MINYKSILKELNSVQKKINQQSRISTKTSIYASSVEANGILNQRRLTARIRNKRWKSMLQDAKKRNGKLLKNMNMLILSCGKTNSLIEKRNALISGLNSLSKPASRAENWQEKKTALITKLRQKNFRASEISRFIKNMENLNFNGMIDSFGIIDRERFLESLGAFNKLLAAYTDNYYLICCLLTNINYKSRKKTNISRNGVKTQLKELKKQMSSFRKNITKKRNNAFAENNSSIERIMDRNIKSRLLSMANTVYKKPTKNRKQFDGALENSIGIGEAIRNSILLVAACKRASFYYANRNISPDFGRWQKSVSIKEIVDRKAQRHVNIDNIVKNGTEYSRKKVTIKGRVIKLFIRHIAKKPISHAFVTNGRNTVSVTIPHIKIDSGGLAEGTYAELTGIWMQRNKEALNRSSLSLDRIDNKRESRKYWLNWLALEMNDIYETVPHSLNIKFSWKPGIRGAINQIKFHL